MKINFNNVSFAYSNKDKLALNNINFQLDKKEIVFVLGHTGSGKSTLVQHLNGLLFPTSGEVTIEIDGNEYKVDKKEKRIKELRKNVGLVFQFPENQLFESSVLKDVMFGPLNFGYSLEEASKLAKSSLTLLGIDETYYQRSPFDLSGGEKRKVAIAGVIASKPKILILDEPTSSLDNRSTRDFFDMLVRLKEKGIMIIVVSHDVNLCYEYADKVIILAEGNMEYFGDYNHAFLNDKLLEKANIEKPFVLKAKEKLSITSDIRNIKQLVKFIREESQDE
jgi:energy-coupling factor transport system ATP-binding protein